MYTCCRYGRRYLYSGNELSISRCRYPPIADGDSTHSPPNAAYAAASTVPGGSSTHSSTDDAPENQTHHPGPRPQSRLSRPPTDNDDDQEPTPDSKDNLLGAPTRRYLYIGFVPSPFLPSAARSATHRWHPSMALHSDVPSPDTHRARTPLAPGPGRPHQSPMNEFDLPCADCDTSLIGTTVPAGLLLPHSPAVGPVTIAVCPDCDARYVPEATLETLADATTQSSTSHD